MSSTDHDVVGDALPNANDGAAIGIYSRVLCEFY